MIGLPPSLSGLSQATKMQSLLTLVIRAFFGSLGTSRKEYEDRHQLHVFLLESLNREMLLSKTGIPNGYLAIILSEASGSEIPNRFSARTRNIYSSPGISFPILQLVFVTEDKAVTQSPRLTSHFSTT